MNLQIVAKIVDLMSSTVCVSIVNGAMEKVMGTEGNAAFHAEGPLNVKTENELCPLLMSR